MPKILDLTISSVYPKRHNSRLLPQSIWACIIGKSGCGKINLLFNYTTNQLVLHKFNYKKKTSVLRQF